MLDLSYAEPVDQRRFDCTNCNELTQRQRNCAQDGFENIPEGRGVKLGEQRYTFCPGKASWYQDIIKLYYECELAYHTGIMPSRGSIKDQESAFAEVLPEFVRIKDEKQYRRQMQEYADILVGIAQAIFGKGKGKGSHGRNQNSFNKPSR